VLEQGPGRRGQRGLTVNVVDDQFSARTVLGEVAQRARRERSGLIEGRQRDEASAAAFDIQHWVAVHEHDVRASSALQPFRDGPGEGRPERVGRVGGRQHVDTRPVERRRPFGAQPIHGTRQGELRRSETFDEVTATDLASFLHRPQDRVYGGETAGDALAEDRLAAEHAVAFE
jgi:hypothetical protein